MTTFRLGDLLSITTGRLLAPDINGLDTLVDHMISTVCVTREVPDFPQAVATHLLLQHPWLADVEVPEFTSRAEVEAWMDTAVATYGERHEVAPIPRGAYPLKSLSALMAELRLVAEKLQTCGGDASEQPYR